MKIELFDFDEFIDLNHLKEVTSPDRIFYFHIDIIFMRNKIKTIVNAKLKSA